MNSNHTLPTIVTTLTLLGLALAGPAAQYAVAASAKAVAASAKAPAKATAASAKKPATKSTSSTKKAASAAARTTEAGNAANEERLAAKKAVASLTSTQKSKMLVLVNEGSPEELLAIDGIGKTRATAVAKARPFSSLDQLADVSGVGDAVFGDLIAHAKSLTARRSAGSSTKSKTSTSATAKRKRS